MKILVTGSSGFVGSQVMVTFSDSYPLDYQDGVDLLDVKSLEQEVSRVAPDVVLHLAAQSNVAMAFKDPMLTFDINFKGTFNLLQALKHAGFSGRFLYVSSGDVYGAVSPDQLPITEDILVKPGNPYAVSKIAAEALCYQRSKEEKFDILVARPFNHIGPGQAETFAIAGFAKQIVEIKLGLREPTLWVGDIDVTRDFTDVRDVIRAYSLLLEKGDRGEIYNVCSGKERMVRSLIEKLLDLSGVTVKIQQDKDRMRVVDQRRVFASAEKLHKATGWQPEVDIDTTLANILTYWEERLV